MIETALPPRATSRSTDKRADIQALRALAVLAVVLFHLWPNRLTGGYVGVDVFFVISGFLIGTHLLRELEAKGTISLGAFWARRAKRLLPASLLVLLLTAVATLVWVPRSLWNQFLSQVTASALYVENWKLAHDSVDYLASTAAPAPVQHFWTLSTEEQFYIGLPLLLMLVVLVARRWSAATRHRAVVTVLVAAGAASLAYSIWLTAFSPSTAYFSTFTRAWEFGAGVLLGCVTARFGDRARRIGPALGVGLILVASVSFGSTTAIPGFAASLPVVGALVVIATGAGTWLHRLGEVRPVAYVGDVSYAAYLVHWPMIVLLPYATMHPLTTSEKLAILALTLVLAGLCTRWVENPVRFRLLGSTARPRTVAAWSVAAMAVVVGAALVPAMVNQAQLDRSREQAAALVADGTRCLGAAALLVPDCTDAPAPERLIPDPADLMSDDSNRTECWSKSDDYSGHLNLCTLGPKTYSKHLLAVGDSHNNTLIAAYDQIAKERGWRIDVAGRAGCNWSTAPLRTNDPRADDACTRWREAVTATVETGTDLDGIVVTYARDAGKRTAHDAGEDVGAVIRSGMVGAWATRPDAATTPIVAIGDNPTVSKEVLSCVEREGLDARTGCALDRRKALEIPDEQRAASTQSENAHFVPTDDLYCGDDRCDSVIGGVVVYRDAGSHLTATYVSTIASYLGNRIAEVLPAR
ncbi:MAG: acyltransferase family protein [Brevundimonas sp.]